MTRTSRKVARDQLRASLASLYPAVIADGAARGERNGQWRERWGRQRANLTDKVSPTQEPGSIVFGAFLSNGQVGG